MGRYRRRGLGPTSEEMMGWILRPLLLLALVGVTLKGTLQLVAWLKEHVPEPLVIVVVIVGLVLLVVRR